MQSYRISYLKEQLKECKVNRKGKRCISHIRPSFEKHQRAGRSELCTMRLRELTRKHHPLTIVQRRDQLNRTNFGAYSSETGSNPWHQQELLGVMAIKDEQLDLMMRKWDLWKAIRICSWMARFVWNSRSKHQQKTTGPITTEEITKQLKFWARRSQDRNLSTTKFEEDKLHLNL